LRGEFAGSFSPIPPFRLPEAARAIADFRADAHSQARIDELADKCYEGLLTPEEAGHRFRRGMGDPVQHIHEGLPLERQLACRHIVKNHAQAECVGTVIHRCGIASVVSSTVRSFLPPGWQAPVLQGRSWFRRPALADTVVISRLHCIVAAGCFL
jgi:hypothetical protein